MDYQEDLARMAFLELRYTLPFTDHLHDILHADLVYMFRVHKVSRYSVVISQHSSYHSDLYLGLICLLDLMEGS
jgi:hypothetical protein